MKEKKNFQKQKKEAKESRFKKKMSEIKRMIYLIYRNYRDGETQILAISLTYYSLLAIFPVVALVLGITKGFGLDKIFIQKFFELWPGNNSFLRVIVDVAQRLLLSTESSILTGVGIVILIYSAVKVLIMLENSFNKIWKINKKRSITRRVIDYIAIIFFGKCSNYELIYWIVRACNIHYFVQLSILCDSKHKCKNKTSSLCRNCNDITYFWMEIAVLIITVVNYKIQYNLWKFGSNSYFLNMGTICLGNNFARSSNSFFNSNIG